MNPRFPLYLALAAALLLGKARAEDSQPAKATGAPAPSCPPAMNCTPVGSPFGRKLRTWGPPPAPGPVVSSPWSTAGGAVVVGGVKGTVVVGGVKGGGSGVDSSPPLPITLKSALEKSTL